MSLVLLFNSAAAVIHDVAVAETLAAADAQTVTLAAAGLLTESVTAADSSAGTWSNSSALTETVAASESVAGTFTAATAATESVTAADVSDATLGAMSYSVDATDSLTVTETITATLALVPVALQPGGFSTRRRPLSKGYARLGSGLRRMPPEPIPTNVELSDSLTLLESSFASVTSASVWNLEEDDEEVILAAYVLLMAH